MIIAAPASKKVLEMYVMVLSMRGVGGCREGVRAVKGHWRFRNGQTDPHHLLPPTPTILTLHRPPRPTPFAEHLVHAMILLKRPLIVPRSNTTFYIYTGKSKASERTTEGPKAARRRGWPSQSRQHQQEDSGMVGARSCWPWCCLWEA